MGREQLQELEKHGMYLSVPKGISMNPMLYQNDSIAEIHKLTQPPKRYDVVMYIRGADIGVIHRVLHKKDDVYIINGDNCWQKEYVKPDKIYGIVTRFYRRGKWHETTELSYKIYSHLIADLFFIRRPVLRIRDKIRAFIRNKFRS